MKESQVAVMEEFVDNVKILISALGYKVLEPVLQPDSNISGVDDELLYISTGGATATGRVTPERFVVLKGAAVNEKTSMKSLSTGLIKLRRNILTMVGWKTYLRQRISFFRVHQRLRILCLVIV